MSRWGLLRVQDVRDAYRLIGECRDLATEPALWHTRACEGLEHLVGAPTTGGEGLIAADGTPAPVSVVQYGFDAYLRTVLYEYHGDRGPARDPLFLALLRMRAPVVTQTRPQVVRDRAYFRSDVFDRHFRAGNVHHRLVSIHRSLDGRAMSVLHLHRPARDRDFSLREQQILDFFHMELGRLIGRSLISATEPSPAKLSPRLRQTLACLIEGYSEKEVAQRLGLSLPTTHQYITDLYSRFGVHSRAQLLAYVMRRLTRSEWRGTVDVSD